MITIHCGMVAHVFGEQFSYQTFEIEAIDWHADKPRSLTLYDADADESIVVQPNEDFDEFTIDRCSFGAYEGVKVTIEFSEEW